MKRSQQREFVGVVFGGILTAVVALALLDTVGYVVLLIPFSFLFFTLYRLFVRGGDESEAYLESNSSPTDTSVLRAKRAEWLWIPLALSFLPSLFYTAVFITFFEENHQYGMLMMRFWVISIPALMTFIAAIGYARNKSWVVVVFCVFTYIFGFTLLPLLLLHA